MAKVTPEEFQEKQARNLKNSIPDIERGISRMTTAPGVEAGKKQDKMLANLTESVQNGKWKRGVESVSLADWQAKAVGKGIPRIAGGIDAAKDKTISFASKLLPAVDAAAAKTRNMPDRTLQDSIARMTSFVTDMSKFHK